MRQKLSTANALATAECVNALPETAAWQRFWSAVCVKVKAVVLWYALAHNLTRAVALQALWRAQAGM